MITWNEENKRFADSKKHALVLGGPGSGKTTLSLVKAGLEIERKTLKKGQKILFLSFARATIARIESHAKRLLSSEQRGELRIETYHGFAWSLLRSHGYLLSSKRNLRLLPPPQAAAALSSFSGDVAKKIEMRRMFDEEGILHFDLFAHYSSELLRRCSLIRELISDVYPVVILDEFQDTNPDEWSLIQQLGSSSRLIALADAEQRIYEFRGASPTRIPEFLARYKPEEFDFGTDNHRSSGTDICKFGNDLLTGSNRFAAYNDVRIVRYPARKGEATLLRLKVWLLSVRRELIKSGQKDWSLAVLVPTNQLMLDASEFLDGVQQYANGKKAARVEHEVAIDAAGPSLAAVAIGGLLESFQSTTNAAGSLIRNLCNHVRGRKGNKPMTKAESALVGALEDYLSSGRIIGAKRKALVTECHKLAETRRNHIFSGAPETDWLAVRSWLLNAPIREIAEIGKDAKFLRFLNKGSVLRAHLGERWRDTGSYQEAAKAIENALLQEHFSAATRTYQGIHVMTIHKAKGKEFDAVLIYEGPFNGKFLRANATEADEAQALLSLRVAVTRAKKAVIIFTSERDPCKFL